MPLLGRSLGHLVWIQRWLQRLCSQVGDPTIPETASEPRLETGIVIGTDGTECGIKITLRLTIAEIAVDASPKGK
jgi:hypothetical protein